MIFCSHTLLKRYSHITWIWRAVMYIMTKLIFFQNRFDHLIPDLKTISLTLISRKWKTYLSTLSLSYQCFTWHFLFSYLPYLKTTILLLSKAWYFWRSVGLYKLICIQIRFSNMWYLACDASNALVSSSNVTYGTVLL